MRLAFRSSRALRRVALLTQPPLELLTQPPLELLRDMGTMWADSGWVWNPII
jgi:hypothetical protein